MRLVLTYLSPDHVGVDSDQPGDSARAAAQRAAITIKAASDRLGVKPQRISQLMTAGILTGPSYAGRPPRNAARIWEDVLESELARRAEGRGSHRRRTTTGAEASGAARWNRIRDLERDLERERGRERAAVAAAQHFKVAADRARAIMRDERKQARRVTAELERVAKQLERVAALLITQQDLTDRADDVAEEYSAAATQLLTPSDTGDIDE